MAEPAGDTITVDGVTFRVRWNPARKRYDLYIIRDSLDTRIESTLDLGYALERPGSPG